MGAPQYFATNSRRFCVTCGASCAPTYDSTICAFLIITNVGIFVIEYSLGNRATLFTSIIAKYVVGCVCASFGKRAFRYTHFRHHFAMKSATTIRSGPAARRSVSNSSGVCIVCTTPGCGVDEGGVGSDAGGGGAASVIRKRDRGALVVM